VAGSRTRPGSWSGRRVTVVAAFDSFLRAAVAYANHLEARGAEVRYRVVLARPAQISPDQLAAFDIPAARVRTVPMDALASRSSLEADDLVLLALNGLRTRRFMVRMHRAFAGAPRRPVVASLYPGLVFRFHLEGMSSRMAADVLLLNSPKDLRLYEGALAEMGLVNENALCAGLSFLPSRRPTSPSGAAAGGGVLFAAQPTVPAGRAERRYVVHRLLERARRHPEVQWWLKPRHRRVETTLHRVDHHYEDLVDEAARVAPLPPNFSVVHEPMRSLLERTRLCLTMSSTAALEALSMGVPTRVLTDIGIHENLGNHFFIGSGLCCSFDDVRPDLPHVAREEWLRDNVVSATDRLPEILARFEECLRRQAEAPEALPPPYPRTLGRAPAFDDYVRETAGWAALERFGGRGASARQRVRRITGPASILLARGWERATAWVRRDGRGPRG